MCSDSTPSLGPHTHAKLQAKNPQGSEDFDKTFWPSAVDMNALRQEDDWRRVAEEHFSIDNIRKYFARSRARRRRVTLTTARPCDLRVPPDCVAEWRFTSSEQKNSCQDPPPRKGRSNIWSQKNSDLRQKYLREPVRRPREFETRDYRGVLWRRFCKMETSFLIFLTLVSH